MGKFPGLHRRAIAIIAIILLVIFFWPKGEDKIERPQASNSTQDLPVPVAPSVSTDNQEKLQTTLPPAQDSLDANENTYSPTENGSDNNTIENNTESPAVKQQQQPITPADAWQTYTIKEGQTLAQLFRDNNLAVNDAFSMAKSEDKQKSLSQLRSGQTIRLQRNPQGEVSMLEVKNSAGTVITFTRLSDGSYYRTP